MQATPVKDNNPTGIRIATPTMAIRVAQRARPGEAGPGYTQYQRTHPCHVSSPEACQAEAHTAWLELSPHPY